MSSLAKTFSATILGLEAILIEVEADIKKGLPGLVIVGLPDKAVEEAKERVKSAILNSQQNMPAKKITINLAPADIKKEGPVFDLAIAVGILMADNQVKKEAADQAIFLGELALSGQVRPIKGVLPVMLTARQKGVKNIFLPAGNALEASLIKGLNLYPVDDLSSLVSHLNGLVLIKPYQFDKKKLPSQNVSLEDFAYVAGQEHVKRALEIAASGGHNILMSGPPGSGKTMLAKAFGTILPDLSSEEILEVSKIYSVSGLLEQGSPLIFQRPVRHPHHTTSSVAIVGGGSHPKPGEITLAHKGVLFFDELPEFHRDVLEALRQPLEDQKITVSRAQGTLTFPADFIFLAACNPCPCGFLTDPTKNCVCTPYQIIRYRKKLSGPLLDRIDMHVEVPRLAFEKLSEKAVAEESKKIKIRVARARKKQLRRNKGKINSRLTSREVKNICQLDEQSKQLMKHAVDQLNLSARGYFKILKISRTIADLEESENITVRHLTEALQYRSKVEHSP